jgi:hypothetical protein
MRYIPADFNGLGYEEPNQIPLAPQGWPTYERYHLQVGERVIVYESLSLEAEGVTRLVDSPSGPYWVVDIDPATMRDITYAEPPVAQDAPTA